MITEIKCALISSMFNKHVHLPIFYWMKLTLFFINSIVVIFFFKKGKRQKTSDFSW